MSLTWLASARRGRNDALLSQRWPELRMVRKPSPQSGDSRTRVLIVDDHMAFSEALGMAVDLVEDLECAGVASTVAEALDLVEEQPPDVVLIDVRLPGVDGIEGTRRLKELVPETRILVITAHGDLDIMARATSAGACGFISKERPLADILEAIRSARDGAMFIERSSLIGFLDSVRESELKPVEQPPSPQFITPREREVLGLMGEGLDPQAIARRLGISIHTSRGHVKNILTKLGARSQLEAVVTAIREGILLASNEGSVSSAPGA